MESEEMIGRYENKEIKQIWSNENKLALWQANELALMQARVNIGEMNQKDYNQISEFLKKNPIDIAWWKNRDSEIKHDLNAFLEERIRFLPENLQVYFHKKITSYDTEEVPFALMIESSINVVTRYCDEFNQILRDKSIRYRYTIMNGRTHGQEAELQSFGKRCLSWLADFQIDLSNLQIARMNLKKSKMSGAIGNYGSIDPELEEKTLEILGFEPFYGSTQIVPREICAPVAQSLCQIVLTLNKIALAIRLGARSGRPIYQEPFAKKQKGSSAMPHKKNTILTEQIEGMARMARARLSSITENIVTMEERSIEQSSVERVEWPDLFHIVVRSLTVMKGVMAELKVYPDQMFFEIINSRGCYAASEAKEFIKQYGVHFDLSAEEAYRIVQLAAFNAFEPDEISMKIREEPAKSLVEAEEMLENFKKAPKKEIVSIEEIIKNGNLKFSSQLEATEKQIEKWNQVLKEIFHNPTNRRLWNQIFQPSFLLKNENTLYEKILGI
jgi:adenylosuccinate lyase